MTAFLYVLMLSCGFLCSILMVHVIVRKITRHFDLLLYRMQQFGEDSTVLAPVPYDYTDRTDEIGILHRQFTHMAERIQTLVVENYRQQLLTKDAQLKSLESQMPSTGGQRLSESRKSRRLLTLWDISCG